MKTANLLSRTAALLLAFTSGEVRAQNLTETFIGFSPSLTVEGTLTGGATFGIPSGVMRFTTFEAFCVEPLQPIDIGETIVYQIQGASSLAGSAAISRLIGGYLQSARTDQDAAAVQWAIWETIVETTLPASLADGNVRIDDSVDHATLTLANQYLANMNSYQPASLTHLTNDTRQDLVTWNAVPEPGTIMLGLASALLLARRRR